MRHVFKSIVDGKCDRTFAVVSQRPAIICETIETVVTENEMVKQSDTQEFSSFAQPCGEGPILRTRRGISGGMIVDRYDVKSR